MTPTNGLINEFACGYFTPISAVISPLLLTVFWGPNLQVLVLAQLQISVPSRELSGAENFVPFDKLT